MAAAVGTRGISGDGWRGRSCWPARGAWSCRSWRYLELIDCWSDGRCQDGDGWRAVWNCCWCLYPWESGRLVLLYYVSGHQGHENSYLSMPPYSEGMPHKVWLNVNKPSPYTRDRFKNCAGLGGEKRYPSEVQCKCYFPQLRLYPQTEDTTEPNSARRNRRDDNSPTAWAEEHSYLSMSPYLDGMPYKVSYLTWETGARVHWLK